MSNSADFVRELYQHLSRRLSQYPQVEVQRRAALETPGLPQSFWPKADILIRDKKLNATFIVHYGNSIELLELLIKCWSYLDACGQVDLAFVGIKDKDATPGRGKVRLATLIGEKLQDLYSNFRYVLLERKGQPPEKLVKRIVDKMNDAMEDLEDIKWVLQARKEEGREEKKDIEEVFAEIERSRAVSR